MVRLPVLGVAVGCAAKAIYLFSHPLPLWRPTDDLATEGGGMCI